MVGTLPNWGAPRWQRAPAAWALDQDDADAEEECGVNEALVIDEERIKGPKDEDQPDQPLERHGTLVRR